MFAIDGLELKQWPASLRNPGLRGIRNLDRAISDELL